jgi:ribosomal protein S18 acetylase RimI-like enzyme
MTKPATTATGRASAPFSLRPATPDDTAAIAALYEGALAKPGGGLALADAPQTAAALDLMSQTGSAFVVAERDGRIAGAVRYWDDDGIAWFDILAAGEAGAGRALVRTMETGAQDRGLRLIRARLPEESRLPAPFSRWGYRTVSRTMEDIGGRPVAILVLEKRLPLLTVREQRRSDAPAIGELTGEDPWVFEQGARPGWFVTSDGDSIVGVISVRDAGAGVATISQPILLESHRGRGIEVWMVERCATYAETNGYHTAELPLTDATDAHRKALEDRFWQREPPLWVKRFRSNAPVEEDD